MQKLIAATLLLFLSACSLGPVSPPITASPTSPPNTTTPASSATATKTPTPNIPPANVPAELLPAPLYSLSEISGTVQVWRVNQDGSQTRITNEAEGVTSMDVSPMDGSLAYVSGQQLILADKNGFLPRVLVDGFEVKRPVWSPDGTKLAYALDGVKVFNLETGEWSTVVSNINSGDRNMRLYTPLQWSPDGEKIVVEVGFYECSDYKLYTTDGAELQTFGFGSVGSSLWSADSQTLYFASPVSGGACGTEPGFWKINAQTGEMTAFVNASMVGGVFYAGWPVIAPDGTLQFFYAETPSTDAFVDVWEIEMTLVRTALKARLKLEALPQQENILFDWNNAFDILWAPDASFALLTRQTHPYSQTTLMKTSDETPIDLGNLGWNLRWGLAEILPATPQASGNAAPPAAGPDQQYRVAFIDRNGPVLRVVNADGNGLVNIYPWWEGNAPMQHPIWSSNGAQLAFIAAGMVYQVDLRTNAYGPFPGLPLPGEDGPDKYNDIAWSPGGGRYLAFHYTSNEDIGPFRADRNLGIYNLATGGWVTFPILQVENNGQIIGTAALPNNGQRASTLLIPLTGGGGGYDATIRPAWSTDGTRLAFLGFDPESKEGGIYIGNTDGTARLVDKTLRMPSTLTWSPDGKSLYCVAFFEEAYQIFSIQVNTGQVTQLTFDTDWVVPRISLSPDGRKIVYSSNDMDPRLYVMNTDGTEIIELVPSMHNLWYPSWSPDGKQILFIYPLGDDMFDLDIVNADGTELRTIYSYYIPGDITFPVWSPVPGMP